MYKMSKNLEQKIQKQKNCNRKHKKHLRKKRCTKWKNLDQKINKKTASENTWEKKTRNFDKKTLEKAKM